ncbi:hypothetical protein FNW02_34155 [Komarekiella sp. 'clone 1']|uniref:Uncharacterized protein n=1 Tax=Komarekiella delphini-convector SJRDD-AB1 TaxID=2593771 RepID=A0AA40T4B0_9NOST|nr:hypothetical protein [Komarekiella delphini-convector]MBD6620678.1 hypothetical protein [Komarekiella delphini-convector SJRDD-AB1]
MNLESRRQRLLKILLIASIISTGIHFTDNYLFIERYPQPNWITAPSIYQSWLILTILGITAYWLYKYRKFWLSYGCLLVYSLTGLASPGHYIYGSLSQFSAKMHLFIWTDGLTGLAILGFIIWSALILKQWRREPRSTDDTQS